MAELSPCQKEKLEFYFRIFDDDTGILSKKALSSFTKKVKSFTGWEDNSKEALHCLEVHECLLEALSENMDGDSKEGDMDTWIKLWTKLLRDSKDETDFPLWLQWLPKCLFGIIDRKGDGFIDADELAEFYKTFIKVTESNNNELPTKKVMNLNERAIEAINQMTDYNRYPLRLESFKQIFDNFLLGRTPYGPGRFLFGCFEHKTKNSAFRILPPASDDEVKPVTRRTRRLSTDISIVKMAMRH